MLKRSAPPDQYANERIVSFYSATIDRISGQHEFSASTRGPSWRRASIHLLKLHSDQTDGVSVDLHQRRPLRRIAAVAGGGSNCSFRPISDILCLEFVATMPPLVRAAAAQAHSKVPEEAAQRRAHIGRRQSERLRLVIHQGSVF